MVSEVTGMGAESVMYRFSSFWTRRHKYTLVEAIGGRMRDRVGVIESSLEYAQPGLILPT